jgi:hypothetical protein
MATSNTPCGIAIPQDFADPSIDASLIRQFIPRAEALGYEGLWVQEQIVGNAPILEPVTLRGRTYDETSLGHIGADNRDPQSRSTSQKPGLAGSTE